MVILSLSLGVCCLACVLGRKSLCRIQLCRKSLCRKLESLCRIFFDIMTCTIMSKFFESLCRNLSHYVEYNYVEFFSKSHYVVGLRLGLGLGLGLGFNFRVRVRVAPWVIMSKLESLCRKLTGSHYVETWVIMSKFWVIMSNYFRHNDSLSIFDIIVFDIMTGILSWISLNKPHFSH